MSPDENLLTPLIQQLSFAPAAKRRHALHQAEALHDQLPGLPEDIHLLPDIWQRLLGHPPADIPTSLLDSITLGNALRALIHTLSSKLDLDGDEEALTQQELAERWNVSTKTLQRWRENSLRWRRGKPSSGGRRQVVFPISAILAFEDNYPDRVERAGEFARMTDDQRTRILLRARRLSEQLELSAHAVATHLARRTPFTREAIRLTLLKHDSEQPDDVIFPNWRPPLTEADHKTALEMWRTGTSITRICTRMQRSRATIYRAILSARAEEILAQDLPWPKPGGTWVDPPALIGLDAPPAGIPPRLRPWLSFAPFTEAQTHAAREHLCHLAADARKAEAPLKRGILRAKHLGHAEEALAHLNTKRAHLLLGLAPWLLDALPASELAGHLLIALPALEDALPTLQHPPGELRRTLRQRMRDALSDNTTAIPEGERAEYLLAAWLASRVPEGTAARLSGHAAG